VLMDDGSLASCLHLNPVKILQKEVISAQKQPGCKKRVRPCLKWPVWKKLWNQRGRPRNGCDGVGWWENFNNNNLCCLILASPGISKNWPELLLLKFSHQPTPSQPFLGRPLWLHNFFHTGHFKQGRTLFLQPGCFWADINISAYMDVPLTA